jgi:hypothetical protein
MMHGDRERQRRKAQQQVGKQPNDGSFDGAFGSRDFPGARAGTPVMACPMVAMSACAR